MSRSTYITARIRRDRARAEQNAIARAADQQQDASDVHLSWNERRVIYWALRHVGEMELADRFCKPNDGDYAHDLAGRWGVQL